MRRALIAIGIFILIFIALLPTLVSTKTGQRVTVNLINRAISSCIKVDRFSLSWLGRQQVEGFSLENPSGEFVFTFEKLESETSLLSLLLGSRNLSKTVLYRPYLHYKTPEKDESKTKPKRKKTKTSREWIRGDIEVIEGGALLEAMGSQPITVKGFHLVMQRRPSTFELVGQTEQAGSGSFSLSGMTGKNMRLHADFVNFPVDMIDIFRGGHLFTTALGHKLDLKGDLEKKENTLFVTAQIDADNVQGNIQGHTEKEKFIVDPASKIDFTVTPQLFDELVEAPGWHLANKPKIAVKIQELIYSLKSKEKAIVSAHLDMEKAEIAHETFGNFSVADFAADVQNKGNLDLNFTGNIQSKGGTTEIKGKINHDFKETWQFDVAANKFPTVLLELLFKNGKMVLELIGSQIDFTSKGTYKDGDVKADYGLCSTAMNVQGKIEGNDLSDLHLTANGNYLLGQKQAYYLGEQLHLDLDANVSLVGGAPPVPYLEATLFNERLSVQMKGRLGKKNEPFDPKQIDLVLRGKIIEMPLGEPNVVIKDGTLFAKIDGEKNLALFTVDASGAKDIDSEIHANIQLEQFIQDRTFNFKEARVLVQGNARKFPAILLGKLLESEIPYPQLIGSFLDTRFEVQYLPKRDFAEHLAWLDFEIAGEGFEADISVSVNEGLHIVENKPSFIHWELTPERYRTLVNLSPIGEKSSLDLDKTAVFDLKIKALTCPTPVPRHLGRLICQSGFVGDVKIEGLSLHGKDPKDWLKIPLIEGSVEGQDFSKEILVKLSGAMESGSIPKGEKSGFMLNGEMLDLWTESGKFNRERLKVKGELHLDLVPVKEMLCWLPIGSETTTKIYALLGPLVNGRIYGEISELSGPLTVDIKSTNFKALIPMQLQNGVVYLQKAIETELTLTPEVSDVFLKDINPLFITGARSDHPVKLYIDANGFVLPLHPFSFSQMRVETAVIDFGKISVRNGGQLNKLVDFLKLSSVTPDGMMEAWFTPIYVNLSGGVASYRRFDLLLAGQLHLAFWGNIDLLRDQVNMTLGVSEQSLNQAFNIAGIEKGTMFQIKMFGSTGNLQVDWKGAATRIGIIVAKSSGGIGKLVGGILESFVKNMGEGPTPPPTTYPFPWGS